MISNIPTDIPACPKNSLTICRISARGGVSNETGWIPEFNRQGKLMDPDGNTFTEGFSCSVCHAFWTRSTTNNVQVWTRKI